MALNLYADKLLETTYLGLLIPLTIRNRYIASVNSYLGGCYYREEFFFSSLQPGSILILPYL